MKMKLTDKEMEEWLSAHLSKGPQFSIPEEFASRVARMVRIQIAQSAERRWTILMWSLVAMGLIAASTMMVLYGQPGLSSMFPLVVKFKWMILFGLIIIVIIEMVDHLLMSRRLLSRS
jgi:hypothetical protein